MQCFLSLSGSVYEQIGLVCNSLDVGITILSFVWVFFCGYVFIRLFHLRYLVLLVILLQSNSTLLSSLSHQIVHISTLHYSHLHPPSFCLPTFSSKILIKIISPVFQCLRRQRYLKILLCINFPAASIFLRADRHSVYLTIHIQVIKWLSF